MGVSLAVALLTTIFYIHMEQNSKCVQKRIPKIVVPVSRSVVWKFFSQLRSAFK
jgi:hypothetical protein